MKRFLLFFGLLTAQATAVPVLSGGVTGFAGVPIPLGGGVFTQTVTRAGAINPSTNIAAAETAAGLTSGTLPGGFFRAGLLQATFTDGLLGDGISFTARATTFLVGTATPAYSYFAALDDLTGANPTLFLPLNLTATDQTFSFLLPAAGNYQFSIGALRTNPTPTPLAFGVPVGSYGTTITLSNLVGFGTPELDPMRSSLPLLFSGVLLLSLRRRSAVASVQGR